MPGTQSKCLSDREHLRIVTAVHNTPAPHRSGYENCPDNGGAGPAFSSPGSVRLLHLDAVRGIAILLVLGRHTPAVVRVHPIIDALFDYLHSYGYLGVDLFFVLSGFLIGGILFAELSRQETIEVRRFLIRRAFKIWPAYLCCLTACIVVSGAVGTDWADDPHPIQTVFADMWPAYLHLQNYFPSTNRFAWFWSLGVEEHFYLLLPWIILLFQTKHLKMDGGRVLRQVAWLTLVIAGACLAFRGLAKATHPVTDGYSHYFPTHLRIDSLMVGVLLAAAARFSPGRLAPWRRWRWLLGLFAVGVFVLPTFLPDGKYESIYPFDCPLLILGSAAVVILAYFADQPCIAEGDKSRAGLGYAGCLPRGLALIGFYSYSIYLWHGYFGPPITKRLLETARLPVGGSGVATLAHFAIYLLVTVLLGVLSYWLIERPFLGIRDRLFPRHAAVSADLLRGATS